MTNEKDCIFCKILTGESEVSLVHRDDVCAAFMDIQPVNPGHLLVTPNRHAAYLADLKAEEGAQIFRVAQRLAAALRRGSLKCEGVNFFLANGEAAMQEVFHVHLHVFPRYAGDGFGLKHAHIIAAGFKTLSEGDRVSFEVAEGPKGLEARNVA